MFLTVNLNFVSNKHLLDITYLPVTPVCFLSSLNQTLAHNRWILFYIERTHPKSTEPTHMVFMKKHHSQGSRNHLPFIHFFTLICRLHDFIAATASLFNT